MRSRYRRGRSGKSWTRQCPPCTRTKVALLYKKTGNLRACQLLLGHTKLESTIRYLGVELDDALALSEALEI